MKKEAQETFKKGIRWGHVSTERVRKKIERRLIKEARKELGRSSCGAPGVKELKIRGGGKEGKKKTNMAQQKNVPP